MSDLQWLFLVLAILYGWECACWIRRGSVACRTWLGKHWRILHPGTLMGNQRGGFVFACPLPPLGKFLTGNQLPLSFSPQAVLTYVATSVNPSGRPTQIAKFVSLDEIRNISSKGHKLLVNNQLLFRAASTTYATVLAQQLRQLSQLPADERPAAIEEVFRASCDNAAIQSRWREFQKQVAPVRWFANFVFVYLFILAPLAIWNLGFKRCWLELLVGLLALTITTGVLFRRVHKQFYPQAEDDRFTHTLIVMLSPATTMRAHDILSRPLFEPFHPLAVALVFCSSDAFRQFARTVLLDIRHPCQPICPGDDAAWRETELFSRKALATKRRRVSCNKTVLRLKNFAAHLHLPMQPAFRIARVVARNSPQPMANALIAAVFRWWLSSRRMADTRLEILLRWVIFMPCRYTSFIVKSADGTAKFSFVPEIGKGRHVRNVVPRNFPRNFPCSLPPLLARAAATLRHVRLAAVRAVVVAAVRITIKLLLRSLRLNPKFSRWRSPARVRARAQSDVNNKIHCKADAA